MATLLTKGLIVAGGLAGASATVGGIYYLKSNNSTKQDTITNKETSDNQDSLQPKTVSIDSLLKEKILLKKGDNEKWNAPWGEFVATYKTVAPKLPWKFADWKVNGDNASNLESFKTQCVDLGGQKVSGEKDPIFVEVLKYCTTAKDTGNA